MSPSSNAWRGPLATVALVLLGLVLYGRGLMLGFVGDDFILLDAALRHPLGDLLSGRHGLAGFYRPVSRELYFWWWGRVLALGPLGFHLVNALTFAAIVVMIERLGRGWAGPRAGRCAAAAFVLFPPGSALLAWVSCAQDLIALFWALAALLLYRRAWYWAAALAVALAALSKETAAVMPLVLVAMDLALRPRDAVRTRLARLSPSLLALAAAAGIALAVRASWPAGAAASIGAPRQFLGAWRLPFDFARTLFPPDTLAGIGEAFTAQPVLIVLALLLAVLSVPRAGPVSTASPGTADATRASPSPAANADRTLLIFGLSMAVLALIPVGFVVERWRGYYFSLAGVGGSLAAGVVMARNAPVVAETALALAALVNFGAGSLYRPVESAAGAARHPHANYAFFRETGALTSRLLAALEPWCASLRALPRTFAAGMPPDPVFESVLGPGLRLVCADTVARVRFLADFTPADARIEFGVLRFDPRAVRFMHERADGVVRARIGEGFLLHARYPVAVACFEAASLGGQDDPGMSYALCVSLAAAGRGAEAEQRWRAARERGAVLEAATMAERLLGRASPTSDAARGSRAPAPRAGPAAADSALAALMPLAAGVLRAPWEADPHRAMGRELLARGRAREATLELAVAAGITRQMADLALLAQGYEAIGALDEALAAYQRSLSSGLPRELYQPTLDRFMALARRTGAIGGAGLDRPRSGP